MMTKIETILRSDPAILTTDEVEYLQRYVKSSTRQLAEFMQLSQEAVRFVELCKFHEWTWDSERDPDNMLCLSIESSPRIEVWALDIQDAMTIFLAYYDEKMAPKAAGGAN